MWLQNHPAIPGRPFPSPAHRWNVPGASAWLRPLASHRRCMPGRRIYRPHIRRPIPSNGPHKFAVVLTSLSHHPYTNSKYGRTVFFSDLRHGLGPRTGTYNYVQTVIGHDQVRIPAVACGVDRHTDPLPPIEVVTGDNHHFTFGAYVREAVPKTNVLLAFEPLQIRKSVMPAVAMNAAYSVDKRHS